MIRLFSERFSGHEVPAPEGAWEAISSQLTLSAAASADGVSELFRERFAEHQVEVDPSAWAHISSQIGHGAAAGGWGAVAGWAAAGIGVLVMTAGVVLWSQKEAPVSVAGPVAATVTTTPATPAPNDAAVVNGTSAAPGPTTLRENAAPVPQPKPRTDDALAADKGPEASAVGTTTSSTLPEPQTSTEPTGSVAASQVRPDVPDEVIHDLVTEADEEALKPAEVRDPELQDAGDVEPPPTYGDEGSEHPFNLFLPNVFTPTGDGINDEYLPQGEGIASVIIRVYSITDNELVFASNELRGWDGTRLGTGQPCPDGHYLYAIEAIDADGKVRSMGQVVRLLR